MAFIGEESFIFRFGGDRVLFLFEDGDIECRLSDEYLVKVLDNL
jgi:hypothetical protein